MVPSITETNIVKAIGDFLTAIMPAGVVILQGQVNRVAEPNSPDFVIMTPTIRSRLATNQNGGWIGVVAPTVITVTMAMQVDIQLDIHGPNSSDNAQTIMSLWRDDYAATALAATGLGLAPLYASEPAQRPFLNAEGQFEDRWTVDLALQANPVVSPPQDYANALKIALVEL